MPLLTDRLSLQPSLRPLSVLVYFLYLTHICEASDAIFCPAISLLGIDGNGGVILNCESKGWQAEPWVKWLDATGKPLPAKDTEETDRGPDDLYTVSSRVTVEKRHSNSFTCRVQQNSTNQTREAQIYIADDFFDIQSSSSSTTIGLAVGLAVCILVILILVGFIVWNSRTKRSHRDQTNERENENRSQSNRTEDRIVTGEETETQPLIPQENIQMDVLNEEEQLRREAVENSRKALEEELQTKNTEIRKKLSDLQQLEEEKKKEEENVKRLKEQLENKNTEVETLEAAIAKSSFLSRSKKEQQKKKKEDTETEVENLKKQLETEEPELDTKTKQIDDKQAEVQQLQEETQGIKRDIQNLTEKLKSNNVKSERSGAAPDQPSSSSVEGNQM